MSKRSIDLLLDLAENKLSDIVPFDREDMREIKILQTCVNELRGLRGLPPLEAAPQASPQRAPVRALQRTA